MRLHLIVVVILLFTVSSSFAVSPKKQSHDGHLCWNNSAWQRTSKIITEVSAPKLQMEASYDVSIFENMDMVFKVSSKQAEEHNSYEIWVVEGRSLISKNDELKVGYEIDYIDAPALMYQLALALISLTPEEDPANVKNKQMYEIEHESLPIKTTTPSASGLFRAPWKASVSLERGESQEIKYEVSFVFSGNTEYDSEMAFTGEILQIGELLPSPISDATEIASWYQYKLGPYSKEYEGGTIFDYGAQQYEGKAQTIGQLRKNHNN